MTTHYRGYKVIGGERTACGRYVEEGRKLQPRVVSSLSEVTCRKCQATDKFKTDRVRADDERATYCPATD